MKQLIILFAIIHIEGICQNSLVITQPGRYCGTYTSTYNQPAIKINFDGSSYNKDNPVIIENSIIEGSGDVLIECNNYVGVWFHKIIISNCIFKGKNTIKCKSAPWAIFIHNPAYLVIQNNTLENVNGILINGTNSFHSEYDEITISQNLFFNTDGRVSNGIEDNFYNDSDVKVNCNGYFPISHSIQIFNVRGHKNLNISWNEFYNEPDKSQPGDVINIYESSGKSATEPIKIHNNYVQGSYPYPSTDLFFPGGGILIADSHDHDCRENAAPNNLLRNPTPEPCPSPNSTRVWPPSKDGCEFIEAYHNQVVNVTGYGIANAYGKNCKIYNNTIVSTNMNSLTNTFYPHVPNFSPPIYVMPFYQGPCQNSDSTLNFSGNEVTNNSIRWVQVANVNPTLSCDNGSPVLDERYIYTAGYRYRNPTLFNFLISNQTLCSNSATFLDEQNEYYNWKIKLKNSNRTVGVIPNGSDVLKRQVPTGTQQNQTYKAYSEVSAINGTVMLPGVTMQLADFSFTVCDTNNNPTIPTARFENSVEDEKSAIIFNDQISIFPNPTTGKFIIEILGQNGCIRIKITNNVGVAIYNETVKNSTSNQIILDLENQSAGLYIVSVQTDTKLYKNKLIIQK